MPKKKPNLTDEQLAQVEALAAYFSLEQIADYFGVCRKTFYNMMQRQPEIEERYKKGKAKAVGAIASSLIQKAREGDTTCMIFFLKTQAGWKETQRIDHTSEGDPVKVDNKWVIKVVDTENEAKD